MRTKKNENIYAISEGISALLTALEELGLEFDRASLSYWYLKDDGQYVSLESEEIPDFELGDEVIKLSSSFNWTVAAIESVEDSDFYKTTFFWAELI